MEDAAHEHRYFVDVEIGEVILISDWSDDGEAREDLTKIEEAELGRYLQIPRAESREGYADMQEFIDTISDERLRELLDVAT